MKDLFVPKKFGASTMRIIDAAESVLDTYRRQGYDLSLRQLYYQFIAKDLFPATWIDEE